MSSPLAHARRALMLCRRHPSFSISVIATIALGIGANAAVFSVLDRVLLRPLPFYDPERLAVIRNAYDPSPPGAAKLALDRADWAARRDLFDGVAAFSVGGLNLAAEGSHRVEVAEVTPALFDVLAIRPARGRAFLEEDGKPGQPPIAIISDALWRSVLGGRSDVVDRTITVHERSLRVVGVMPPGFSFPSGADLWIPLTSPRDRSSLELFRTRVTSTTIVRLRDGVTIDRAQHDMALQEARFAREHPSTIQRRAALLEPFRATIVGDVRPQVVALFAMSGVILALACVSVVGLVSARSASRSREFAVRLALGGTRRGLSALLAGEAAVLTGVGAVASLGVAYFAQGVLRSLVPETLLDLFPSGLGLRVLAWTGIATAVIVGVSAVTSLFQNQVDLRASLSESVGSGAREAWMTRYAIAGAQIALTLVLVVGAVLATTSMRRLNQIDAGFDPDGVLTASIALPRTKYDTPARSALFVRQALERVQSLPSVTSAGVTNVLPLTEGSAVFAFDVVGQIVDPANRPRAEFLVASPEYFRSMSIRLLEGRDFDASDTYGGAGAVILSESVARRLWAAGGAIGAQIQLPRDTTLRTVVGVVADIRSRDLTASGAARGQMYYPYSQMPAETFDLVVKSSGRATPSATAVAAAIREVDPSIPMYQVRPMRDVVNRSLADLRLAGHLIPLGAALALILALVGTYGIVAEMTSRRMRELRVRLALGATPARIVRLILSKALSFLVPGVVVGLLMAFGVTRVLRSVLYQVGPNHALSYAIASVLVITTSIVVALLPLRPAVLNPAASLRQD